MFLSLRVAIFHMSYDKVINTDPDLYESAVLRIVEGTLDLHARTHRARVRNERSFLLFIVIVIIIIIVSIYFIHYLLYVYVFFFYFIAIFLLTFNCDGKRKCRRVFRVTIFGTSPAPVRRRFIITPVKTHAYRHTYTYTWVTGVRPKYNRWCTEGHLDRGIYTLYLRHLLFFHR